MVVRARPGLRWKPSRRGVAADASPSPRLQGALYAADLGMDPLMARAGDFDQDGFPDVLLTVHAQGRRETRLLLLRNVEDGDGGRTFERVTCDSEAFSTGLGPCDISALDEWKFGYAGSFISLDIGGGGGLDILVLSREVGAGGGLTAKTLTSGVGGGNSYLRAMALNGVCWDWCSEGDAFPARKPLGGGQYGAVLKYRLQDLQGQWHTQVSPQLASSANAPLLLPFVVMGLGATSYFIDDIHVAVPSKSAWQVGLHMGP